MPGIKPRVSLTSFRRRPAGGASLGVLTRRPLGGGETELKARDSIHEPIIPCGKPARDVWKNHRLLDGPDVAIPAHF